MGGACSSSTLTKSPRSKSSSMTAHTPSSDQARSGRRPTTITAAPLWRASWTRSRSSPGAVEPTSRADQARPLPSRARASAADTHLT